MRDKWKWENGVITGIEWNDYFSQHQECSHPIMEIPDTPNVSIHVSSKGSSELNHEGQQKFRRGNSFSGLGWNDAQPNEGRRQIRAE